MTDDLNNLTMPETAAERALREEREAAAALANANQGEVDFEDEDTQDEAQAIEHTRTLKMEYNPDEDNRLQNVTVLRQGLPKFFNL